MNKKLRETLGAIRMPKELRARTLEAMRKNAGAVRAEPVSDMDTWDDGDQTAPGLKRHPFKHFATAAAVLLLVTAMGFGAHQVKELLSALPPLPAASVEQPEETVTPRPSDDSFSAITSDTPAATDDPFGGLQNSIEIGVVLPTDSEPHWVRQKDDFMDAFQRPSEHSTAFTWQVMYSQGDPALEKANVEALIAKGLKVLIYCPQDVWAAGETAGAARAAGVKVICYDRPIPDTDAVDYYVAFDSIEIGEAQGQHLADQAAGQGNPLYLYAGEFQDNNAFLFFEGAWSKLQPKIADGTFTVVNSSEAAALKDKPVLTHDEQERIFGQIANGWNPETAKALAESHLAAAADDGKGDVFILGPNDGTARAIADVFRADPAVISCVITGQDAERDSIQYILDGKQSMTVLKDTRTMARDAAGLAAALLAGQTPGITAAYNNGSADIPFLKTGLVIITKDNVKEALFDSGYYSPADFTGVY